MTWWPVEFLRWGAVAALMVAFFYMLPRAAMWFKTDRDDRAWFTIAVAGVCLSDAIQRVYGGIAHYMGNGLTRYPMGAVEVSFWTNAYAFVGGCLMMRYAVGNVHGRHWWAVYLLGVLIFGGAMAA